MRVELWSPKKLFSIGLFVYPDILQRRCATNESYPSWPSESEPGFFPQNVGELNLWFRGFRDHHRREAILARFQPFIPIAMKTAQQKIPWTFTNARYIYIYLYLQCIYIYPINLFGEKICFFNVNFLLDFFHVFFCIFDFLFFTELVQNWPPPLQKSSFAAKCQKLPSYRWYNWWRR